VTATIDSIQQSEPLVLKVEGSFDAPAAWRIRELLGGLECGARATIDLRQAMRIEDSALALLVPELACTNGPVVSLVGLAVHHWRMLRYLGVRAERPS